MNRIITERVIKKLNQAEAERFFNYPYNAIEEAMVNAVYHRSYEIREPVEVWIRPTSISIVSHPGPDVSITDEDLLAGRMVSRRYRNRRIGEFLKELDFTEGRGTGIPKMRRVLQSNGSPDPRFFTDSARQSFWTEIKIHPAFLEKAQVEVQVEAQATVYVAPYFVKLSRTEIKILELCKQKPMQNKELVQKLGYNDLTGNLKRGLRNLIRLGLIEHTIPNKPTSQNQQNKLTEKGAELLLRVLEPSI